jgi:tetratricopeptide (TPR) repeat protein
MSLKSANRVWILGALVAIAVSTGCRTSPEAKEARGLKRGAELLAKKDYSRALLEFQNASQAMPKDAEPYYQMGLAYLGLANIRGSAASFRRATEMNPKHLGAQVKLAAMMTATRDQTLVEEASKRLETVLENAPANTEANDTLAMAEWELGHADDAAVRLEGTLQKSPADLAASVALAKMKLGARDQAGAEEIFRKAVASAPKSPEAALAFAQFYLVTKQPEKAEGEIQRALTLDPRNGTALAALAAMQVAAHRMQEAEETYKRLAALPDKENRHLHAVFLFQTGRRDQALAELLKLASQDPDDRNARSRLLSAYISMGKIAEAQQVLANALKKNSKDTDALFQRAELNLRSGNAKGAETDLKQVLHFKADSAEAHFALSEVYRVEGAAAEAQRHELNEALRLKVALLPARLALAWNFIASKEAKSALEILDQTPPQQRTLLPVIAGRNWALYATGNYKEMRTVLDQVLKTNRDTEFLLQDSVLKIREGDYAGARVDAEEVLRRNPETIGAAQILADSYMAQKEPQKAIQRLTELAEGRPKSAGLQYLLAHYDLTNGRPTEARRAFEAAKAADPNFVQADLSLARIDYAEKHVDEARRRLAAVLNANPKNVAALLMLANIEAQTGDRNDAIAKYRTILAIDGTNVFALNDLAWSLAPDHPDEALKYAQQAGEIAPDDAGVQDTLGWIYYRKGIYRTAVDYLKNAVAKEATPQRQFHLAMCYMKAGDRELGQKTLNAALQKDPSLLKTEQGW